MKKILLLSLMVLASAQLIKAQVNNSSIMLYADQNSVNPTDFVHQTPDRSRFQTDPDSRALSRYYSFCEAVDKETGGLSFTSGTYLSIWKDSTIVINYSNGAGPVGYSSAGNIFQPSGPMFNHPSYFAGEMHMNPGTTYVIDSVFVLGKYFVPQGVLTNDYVTLSLVKESALEGWTFGKTNNTYNLWTNYGATLGTVDTALYFIVPNSDSVLRTAGTTAADRYVKVQHNLTWADTAFAYVAFALPNPITVNAGEMIGSSFTFNYGGTYTPNVDSLCSDNPTCKNNWRPVYWEENEQQLASYRHHSDFKIDGKVVGPDYNQSSYIQSRYPSFFAPSMVIEGLNYPNQNLRSENLDVIYHVTCATCANYVNTNDVNSKFKNITVYPNPSTQNITFDLGERAINDVNITIYNITGVKIGEYKIAKSDYFLTVDISSFANGVYITEIATEGKNEVRKFTKQ